MTDIYNHYQRALIVEHPFFYGNLIGGGIMYMCFWAMYKLSPIRGFITMAYTPIKEKEPEGFLS